MLRPRILLPCVTLAILASATRTARADVGFGFDWRVANAEQVLLVHVPTLEETRVRPEWGKCWIVDEVYKGIETRRAIPRVGHDDLAPGANGFLLVQAAERADPPLAASMPQWTGSPASTAWLAIHVEQGKPVLTIPGDMAGWGKGIAADQTILLDDFGKMIPADEDALQAQLLDALFFDKRFADLAKKDPDRAAYVQMRLAISDLARNVPAIAELLESPNADLRAAAEKRLAALTGATLDIPAATDAAALAAHAAAWRDWWSAHRAGLIWREATEKFEARRPNDDVTHDRWPDLPKPLAVQPDALVAALKQSMAKGKPDAAAFAAAMRAFLDGGARRDAVLFEASVVEWQVPENAPLPARPEWVAPLLARHADMPGGIASLDDPRYTPDGLVIRVLFPNCLFRGSGGNLFPQLDSRLMLDANVPLDIRWHVLANYVRYAHWPEFFDQRKAALAYIKDAKTTPPPGYHDALLRAAFWEASNEDSSEETIAPAAFELLEASFAAEDRAFLRELAEVKPHDRLSVNAGAMVLQKSGSPEDQQKLVKMFLANPNGGTMGAVYFAAKAGQKIVIAQLIEDLKTSTGERFRQEAGALTSAKVSAANPNIAARLVDADDFVRLWAARQLGENVTKDIEPALLAAWSKEKSQAVRQELVVAISQAQDPKALDVLLAAATDKWEPYIYATIARGLRKFNDPKVLPVLADLTVRFRNDRMALATVNEAMISFGAISGLYAVPRPINDLGQNHPVNPQLQSAGLAAIDQWLKEHPADTKP